MADRHLETEVLHRAEGARPGAAPLTTPIYATSTFVFESAAEIEAYLRGDGPARYLYSRHANPTVEAVEEKLAVLEGADAALATASGMSAAATALFGLLQPGDELVCSAGVYGGTLQLVTSQLSRFGVSVRLVPIDALHDPAALLGPRTRAVWFESPINPTLRCVDIRAIASACRAHGALSLFDNTFASPINQRPIELGVDLVMHSATKYLGGHSDLIAGALAGPHTIVARLRDARKVFGAVLDPMAAHALSRGLKTLPIRVARQNATAQHVAEWLAQDRRVQHVSYPGLASHPDAALARAQMQGFGGMLCFEVPGGYRAACRVFDRLQIIKRAASLGGVESLCSLPVLTSHYGCSDDQLREAGVTRGMLRLSIGLEHPDDLIADLDLALTP